MNLRRMVPVLLAVLSVLPPAAAEKSTADNPHRAVILDLSARNRTGSTELASLTHCFDIFAIRYTVTESIDAASSSLTKPATRAGRSRTTSPQSWIAKSPHVTPPGRNYASAPPDSVP